VVWTAGPMHLTLSTNDGGIFESQIVTNADPCE
jgi:hypothetical protein